MIGLALGWRGIAGSPEPCSRGREGLYWAEPMDALAAHHPRLFGDCAPSEIGSEWQPEWENSICFTIPYKISEQPASVI